MQHIFTLIYSRVLEICYHLQEVESDVKQSLLLSPLKKLVIWPEVVPFINRFPSYIGTFHADCCSSTDEDLPSGETNCHTSPSHSLHLMK